VLPAEAPAPSSACRGRVGRRLPRVKQAEPRWQPISRLPELTAHIEQGIQLAAEHLATLAGAREQPYVLDDMTVTRVATVFTQTRTDLALYAEQGRHWQGLDLGATRRRDVARFVDLVAQELDLVEQILTLAEELKAATIERMLAKSDLELGLEALTRQWR
jgi:hypothetical protein